MNDALKFHEQHKLLSIADYRLALIKTEVGDILKSTRYAHCYEAHVEKDAVS